MKQLKIILAIIASQVLWYTEIESHSWSIGIDFDVLINYISVISCIYIIYILIVVYKKKPLSSRVKSIHSWLIPVALMNCVEFVIIMIMGPLFAVICKPIGIMLYYLWLCRLTLLFTIPLSCTISNAIINRLNI